jgi:hypothetical protein
VSIDERFSLLGILQGLMLAERLGELADLCEERKLTPAELNEAFDLSIGTQTVRELEAMLTQREGEGRG